MNYSKIFRLLSIRWIIGSALMVFAALGVVQHSGAASISVLAVVNGTPITNIDFEERRNFLIKTTGIVDNAETGEQIDKDVLQMLVDDIIKREEGMRIGRGMEEVARQRADEIIDISFSQHGENPNDVLKRLGIDRSFAEQKFFTDVLWASTVQTRFAEEFANVQNEAVKELERVKANARKPQIDLDEIVLVPGPNRTMQQTAEVANQMVAAIKKGADFGRIAQQFSVAGTSQESGNVGWVVLERLPDDIRAIVENLPSGTVANPVQIDGAVVIYRVNGIRLNGNADPLESIVRVGRMILPVEAEDLESRKAAANTVFGAIAEVKTCQDLNRIHEGYGSSSDFDFGEFKLAEFSPLLREILLPLGINEMSDPINYSEGIVVFMVCDKAVPKLNLPTQSEIETRIRNRHFSVLSSRYLAQLRRKAIIEYKDG